MGTDVTISAAGGPAGALRDAAALVAACEARWSRFRSKSELSRLNALAGQPVVVPRDTFELIAAAIDCWKLTAGRFDPTVLAAVVAAGYDRSFEIASRVARPSVPAPGCGDIELDEVLGAVTLPAGVTLDLGGIAKGHTADIVVDALVAAGAESAIADLGGDVRIGGAPADGAWVIGVADPFDHSRDITTVRIAGGAVATSCTRRRRWTDHGRELHHVIDPHTGCPSTSPLASVTVLAATATWAEVTAKAALIAGDDARSVVRAAGTTGLAVTDDRRVVTFEGFEAFA